MKYGKAREIIAEAIELLSEGDNKYSNKSYNSMEHDKPSTNRLEKPTKPVAKPSAQGRATKSPAVRTGRRKSLARYLRGNRWALRQIARNNAAVSEAIDQLDELSDSKLRGYVMQSAYNAAVDAPTHGVNKRLKGIGTALKKLAGYRSKKK